MLIKGLDNLVFMINISREWTKKICILYFFSQDVGVFLVFGRDLKVQLYLIVVFWLGRGGGLYIPSINTTTPFVIEESQIY